ncbi:hypothetical protein SUGI_0479090 [Cryptomeria japonica]|nr:hypothetical protein SUGI_0479090 [Cryptomeria japonica]
MKSIGLQEDEIKDMFKKDPRLLCLTTEMLDKKLKHLANLGLIDGQINMVLPSILICSVDKLQKNMDFLTHTAGFAPNIVCTYPMFLKSSVEKRLKPRFMLYKYLTAKHSSEPLTISLATMLTLCDEVFSCRFLSNLQTLKLYESYASESSETAISG